MAEALANGARYGRHRGGAGGFEAAVKLQVVELAGDGCAEADAHTGSREQVGINRRIRQRLERRVRRQFPRSDAITV